MRDLKFRAWNIEKAEWFKPVYKAYDGELYDISLTMCGTVIERTLQSNASMLNSDNYVVQQFMGLTDKNGKEIYEGDIIYQGEDKNCWFAPRPVEFINGAWMGRSSENHDYVRIHVEQDRHDYEGSVSNNEWVIIGNIHENPELLKTATE